jgi:hypothetical protein
MGKLGWALCTRLDNRADLGLGRLSLRLCELLEPNRPSGKSPGQGNNTKSAETAGAGEHLARSQQAREQKADGQSTEARKNQLLGIAT